MAKVISLRAVHLCESISRDLKGLPTLGSIYPGRVICPVKPWYQKFVIFLAFDRDETQTQNVRIRVNAPNATSEGEVEFQAGGPYVDIHLTFSMLVPNDGELRVDWKVDNGRWKKAAAWSFLFPDKAKELKKSEREALSQFFQKRMEVHEIIENMEVSMSNLKY